MNFIRKIHVLSTASNPARFLWGFGHNTPLPNARPNFYLQGQKPGNSLAHSGQGRADRRDSKSRSATQIGIAHEIRLTSSTPQLTPRRNLPTLIEPSPFNTTKINGISISI